MANRKNKSSNDRSPKLHPGSSVEDAKKVGGKGDFGVPESNVVGRTYTSQNTKRSDPGAAAPHAGAGESRVSGVGGNRSGPGSSSGGDLDASVIGVGTGGGGVAASGKIHEPSGPDDATGTSRDFASGPPAEGNKPAPQNLTPGDTVQMPDDRTAGPEGADAMAHPGSGNDAFAGEVSSDEASGRNDAGD